MPETVDSHTQKSHILAFGSRRRWKLMPSIIAKLYSFTRRVYNYEISCQGLPTSTSTQAKDNKLDTYTLSNSAKTIEMLTKCRILFTNHLLVTIIFRKMILSPLYKCFLAFHLAWQFTTHSIHFLASTHPT